MRQRESADLLAAQAYRVRHLRDSTKAPGCRPDFQVEGKIFDNYAPRRGSARNMWTDLRNDKILAGQTERLVINLDDSPATIEAVKEQFQNWPMEGLKEVIAIRKGTIEHIYP